MNNVDGLEHGASALRKLLSPQAVRGSDLRRAPCDGVVERQQPIVRRVVGEGVQRQAPLVLLDGFFGIACKGVLVEGENMQALIHAKVRSVASKQTLVAYIHTYIHTHTHIEKCSARTNAFECTR
jgi:hypothetical protein